MGRGAKIAGMAQVCGMGVDLPTVVGEKQTLSGGRITLGFASSDPGSCTSTHGADGFEVEMIVPFEAEPGVAQSLASGAGIPLPLVKLMHPYRYEDKAELTVDAEEFRSFFESKPAISGGISFVKLSLGAQIKEALQRLKLMGKMKLDIQSRDPLVRAQMEKILTEALEKTFFKFIPEDGAAAADPGKAAPAPKRNEGPIPVSFVNAKGDQSAPWNVSASLDLTKATAQEVKTIRLSIEDVDYGTVQSEAEITIRAIEADYFAPEIRAMLEKAK
jgi:hypothetical protein